MEIVGWVLINISSSDIFWKIGRILSVIIFYQKMLMLDKQEIEKHVLEYYVGINWFN